MKILLDHNLPRRLRDHLPNHEVLTAREMKWEELRNGALLKIAGVTFQAFLTVDKNLENEQNLSQLPIPIIVLDVPSNALSALFPIVPILNDLLSTRLDNLLYIVQLDGTVLRLNERRRR